MNAFFDGFRESFVDAFSFLKRWWWLPIVLGIAAGFFQLFGKLEGWI